MVGRDHQISTFGRARYLGCFAAQHAFVRVAEMIGGRTIGRGAALDAPDTITTNVVAGAAFAACAAVGLVALEINTLVCAARESP